MPQGVASGPGAGLANTGQKAPGYKAHHRDAQKTKDGTLAKRPASPSSNEPTRAEIATPERH